MASAIFLLTKCQRPDIDSYFALVEIFIESGEKVFGVADQEIQVIVSLHLINPFLRILLL